VTDELLATYKLLRHNGYLKRQLVARWKCELGECELLDVWIHPVTGQLCFHLPTYKNSRTLNLATSNEEGRAKRTRDGGDDWHWSEHAGLVASAINFELKCDHRLGPVVNADELPSSRGARPRTYLVARGGDVREL
jgi:hypothetical protein